MEEKEYTTEKGGGNEEEKEKRKREKEDVDEMRGDVCSAKEGE